jgi:(1->4)-alpha-D-glucan 1-alpha-D-glucosylmutase
MDVLARGRKSALRNTLTSTGRQTISPARKVALPILGRPYGQALAAGEITVRCDKNGPALVRYFDTASHSRPRTHACATSLSRLRSGLCGGKGTFEQTADSQHYWPSWRSANDEINWRRFFDINELAAIRVEDDEVFEVVHGMILRLYADLGD